MEIKDSVNFETKKIKEFLEPGMFHFVLALILISVGISWKYLGLPDAADATALAERFFEQYGLITLLIAAFIESIFMISFYFPGSFVVVLAILVSDRSFASLLAIVVIGWVSVLSATVVNYWLGREGFYRLLLKLGSRSLVDRMQTWLDKRGSIVVFIAAAHPNLLAIANICMGIARKGLMKVLSLTSVAILFWIPFTVFIFGFVLPNPQENTTILYWVFTAVLLVWGFILAWRERLKQKLNSGVL